MPLKEYADASIAYREARRVIAEALKTNKLRHNELEVLYLLQDKQFMQLSHIATELKRDNPTTSRIVAKLYSRNYIAYYHDEVNDRRKVLIRITENGSQLLRLLADSLESKKYHVQKMSDVGQ